MSTKTEVSTAEQAESGKKVQEFFEGVKRELRLAEWPSRADLIRLTQVVLVLITIVALYCGGLDYLLSLITNKLFNR